MGRETRDSKVPDEQFLKPFDITKFGSDDDPCFGKLYSLGASECRICGDIELCAIKYQQNQSIKRLSAESESNFKDTKEHKTFEKFDKWFKEKAEAGKNKKIVKKLAAKQFPKLTKEEIEKYIIKHF